MRSRKRHLGLPPPSAFPVSGGTQPSIEERNGSCAQGKTREDGQQTIREGMQRLHERPATDLFRHDAPSWMGLVHPLSSRTSNTASGCPVVVMVQPTHDWKSDHFAPCILRGRNRAAILRDLLLDALMRPLCWLLSISVPKSGSI